MANLRELHPELYPYASWLVRVAQANGMAPTITSVYRSPQKQAVLYQRYLKARAAGDTSVLPAAPPGTSWHEQRRAFDLVVRQGKRSPEQRALGNLWRQMGGVWGGDIDPVHFQA